MNNNMVFLGGHNLDFSGSKKDIIDIIDARLSHYIFEAPQFFLDYEQTAFKGREYLKEGYSNDYWQYSDFSLNGKFGITDNRKVFALIGPYGLMLRISNTYIEFTTPIYNRRDWYSHDNNRAVTGWRNFFMQITSLMGGSELLYITQSYYSKYHDFFRNMNITFSEKIEINRKRHKLKIKSFEHYGNGKYPPYFLDTFIDL
jgi:hypothetical protein